MKNPRLKSKKNNTSDRMKCNNQIFVLSTCSATVFKNKQNKTFMCTLKNMHTVVKENKLHLTLKTIKQTKQNKKKHTYLVNG